MDKAEALKVMQGNELGLGKGLSTYPAGDRDERDTHAACLELEQDGKVTRYREGVSQVEGQTGTPYVIWMPLDTPTAASTPAPAEEEDRP